MNIQLILHDNIDKKQYDLIIEASPYKTIYAMSWYLDVVSPGWELLILDNYRFVMPLPVKKKYGIKYLVTPFLCQQLGVFSIEEIKENIIYEFIKAIPYSLYSLQLNIGNVVKNLKLNKRSNFVLPLNKPYELLQSSYSNNFIRCVKKAKKNKLVIEKTTSWNLYKDILLNNNPDKSISKVIDHLESIVNKVHKYAKIEIWNAKTAENSILSCVVFIFWKEKIYYFCPVSTKEGKELFSTHYLLDILIQENANSDKMLDLEGSSIPSIARFYRSTGAQETIYFLLQKPQWLFQLKKKL